MNVVYRGDLIVPPAPAEIEAAEAAGVAVSSDQIDIEHSLERSCGAVEPAPPVVRLFVPLLPLEAIDLVLR